MDIHRCRFVPYPPSTINALAFSHSHISSKKSSSHTSTLRLAIGRANGDIEIWNPLNGAWLQETILRGGKDRSVDGLVWIQDPDEEDGNGQMIAGRLRLFSIGYTTTVTEWDLEKGQPLRQSSGNHGEIWCLAAQPALTSAQKEAMGSAEQWQGQNLIIGCTDGAVVLYSTADQDLQLQRVLVRPSAKKAKVISIVYQDRNIVVAGCTDSTIRVYDTRNGTLVRNMSLGAGPSGGPKEIIVWAVKCLSNGTIVSGDSTGEMRIWDGKTYTLVQRIKSHKQDILSLAMSADGSRIFSGGMDRRTVVYKQFGVGKPRWAEISHRRFHGHDVKAMATFEGKGMSVVASGGPDASPIILPLREYGRENQRTLPSLPQESVVQSAPKKRLFMSWWDREVLIWRINKPNAGRASAESESESEDRNRNRKLVAKVMIKGEANITSASITPAGNLLAVSTAAEVKMFSLKSRTTEEGGALKVTKVQLPQFLSTKGAKLLQFSPNGKWLVAVRKDNSVLAVRVVSDAKKSITVLPVLSKLKRIDRKTEKRVLLGGLGAYDRSVARIAFSSDSRILAVTDLAGYIDTWVLQGQEDQGLNNVTAAQEEADEDASSASSSDASDSDGEEETGVIRGQHWMRNPSASLLPRLPTTAVVLAFRPAPASSKRATSDGISTHPTRNNPHPRSHDLPDGEDRLLVVTAGSGAAAAKILEFNVLRGSLTSWSRSNPAAHFPDEYRGLRDQAKGCVWDISESRERLWLYGTSWLWMFDLSRDLPVHGRSAHPMNGRMGDHIVSVDVVNGSQAGRKRKRASGRGSEEADLRKGTSGAGNKVPDSMLGTGMPRRMERFVMDEVSEVQEIGRRHQGLERDSDVEDGEEEEDVDMDGDLDASGADDEAMVVAQDDEGEGMRGPPHWWNTYKYRPIMGIVPLESRVESGDGTEGSGAGLEVVLVERPIWEADLPPRYYGDQEWEKSGLF
ncbi:MAG: U3 small nucleolar RNA-associated protein [Claussenomyces sp. TS43310]|nr:MAG: U3 small nucleolar RNA-associated protein [Claussenomyces sp. TS43310]